MKHSNIVTSHFHTLKASAMWWRQLKHSCSYFHCNTNLHLVIWRCMCQIQPCTVMRHMEQTFQGSEIFVMQLLNLSSQTGNALNTKLPTGPLCNAFAKLSKTSMCASPQWPGKEVNKFLEDGMKKKCCDNWEMSSLLSSGTRIDSRWAQFELELMAVLQGQIPLILPRSVGYNAELEGKLYKYFFGSSSIWPVSSWAWLGEIWSISQIAPFQKNWHTALISQVTTIFLKASARVNTTWGSLNLGHMESKNTAAGVTLKFAISRTWAKTSIWKGLLERKTHGRNPAAHR